MSGSSNKAKTAILTNLYGRLNLILAETNATAMLSRCFDIQYFACSVSFRLDGYVKYNIVS